VGVDVGSEVGSKMGSIVDSGSSVGDGVGIGDGITLRWGFALLVPLEKPKVEPGLWKEPST